jgi:4-hydroxyphenylpyruvate dioxygenase
MSDNKSKQRPPIGKFLGFDHVVYWVGNAKQAAAYYTTKFGFDYVAYKGLETKDRQFVAHVIKKNRIFLEFQSSYHAEDTLGMGDHLKKHGDGVRDIAFTVEDAKQTFETAKARGAVVVKELTTTKDDNGEVIMGTVRTYGDTTHTFVQRNNYHGLYLPGYHPHHLKEAFNSLFEPVEFEVIDHCVGNQAVGDMEPTAEWYEKMLDFHRFWSVDDSIIHTEYSSLKSIVVADFDEAVKMPINEPANGKRKSQIQEYVDFYYGAGVQHIAFRTRDIIKTITLLRQRGVEFLDIPPAYYKNLRENLKHAKIHVKEDLDEIEKLKILVDFDDKGYLLQLFTKPVEDRPTLFYEFIQRENHQGFGAGNFRALFVCIEMEQEKRGNL